MREDKYQHHDYYGVDDLLTTEHKLIRESVRAFVKERVSPFIEDYAQRAEFPHHLVKELGAIGAFGPTIPTQYGGGGLDEIAYGIIMQELERGDAGIRSTASVQGSLVMYPIYAYGSEEQRMKYLPKLATGELFGCFGLTEPDHGSDPASMKTNFKDKGDHYLLNGAKMWISNAPLADIAVVWARNEAGKIQGLIVERGMEGFTTPTTHGKWSLRASCTGELVFDNVKVPKANLLPNVIGIKGPLGCLSTARYGIAWGAIGSALDCYDTALRYSKERIQFGVPLIDHQSVANFLVDMQTQINAARLLILQAASMKERGLPCLSEASQAKLFASEMAEAVCSKAIQIYGGYGYLEDYPVERYYRDARITQIYEGTSEVQRLVIARALKDLNF